MEEKEIDVRRRAPGTGAQYLMALIKCAEWVSEEYKMLAERNKANIEAVKELYLCACDGVPVEKAMAAIEKKPPEGALRFVRQKYMENITMGDYKEELSGIRNKADVLEQEVMQMSKTLQYIVSREPDFNALFPDKEQKQGEDMQHARTELETAGIEENAVALKSAEEKSTEQGPAPHSGTEKRMMEQAVPKFGTLKKLRRMEFPWQRKESVPEFVGMLLNKGYSSEQIDFLLKCIEEGADIKLVKKIASPKLPINVLQRLLKMEEREEKTNGK